MKIINYCKEFTAITAALLRDNKGVVKDKFLYMDKDELMKMLEIHAYATPKTKLKTWRGLGWIDADGEHFTRVVRIDEKCVRMVKINLTVFETLHRLQTQSMTEQTPKVSPPENRRDGNLAKKQPM